MQSADFMPMPLEIHEQNSVKLYRISDAWSAPVRNVGVCSSGLSHWADICIFDPSPNPSFDLKLGTQIYFSFVTPEGNLKAIELNKLEKALSGLGPDSDPGSAVNDVSIDIYNGYIPVSALLQIRDVLFHSSRMAGAVSDEIKQIWTDNFALVNRQDRPARPTAVLAPALQ